MNNGFYKPQPRVNWLPRERKEYEEKQRERAQLHVEVLRDGRSLNAGLEQDSVHKVERSLSRYDLDRLIAGKIRCPRDAKPTVPSLTSVLVKGLASKPLALAKHFKRYPMMEMGSFVLTNLLNMVLSVWPKVGVLSSTMPFELWITLVGMSDVGLNDELKIYHGLCLRDSAELCRLQSPFCLTIISLESCASFDDDCLLAIRMHCRNSIALLDLSRTSVSDSGFRKMFMAGDTWPALEIVQLRGCKNISRPTLETFVVLDMLCLLDVRETRVQRADADAFRHALTTGQHRFRQAVDGEIAAFDEASNNEDLYRLLHEMRSDADEPDWARRCPPLAVIDQIKRPGIHTRNEIETKPLRNVTDSLATPSLGKVFGTKALSRDGFLDIARETANEEPKGRPVAGGQNDIGPLWMRQLTKQIYILEDLVGLEAPKTSRGCDRGLAVPKAVTANPLFLLRLLPLATKDDTRESPCPVPIFVPRLKKKEEQAIKFKFGQPVLEPIQVQKHKKRSNEIPDLLPFLSQNSKKAKIAVQPPIAPKAVIPLRDTGKMSLSQITGSRQRFKAFSR